MPKAACGAGTVKPLAKIPAMGYLTHTVYPDLLVSSPLSLQISESMVSIGLPLNMGVQSVDLIWAGVAGVVPLGTALNPKTAHRNWTWVWYAGPIRQSARHLGHPHPPLDH